ncbi:MULTISPECIES: ABC1 kinase family protein [Prochlorococcus]|uniref:ABC1 kinase family protein n=1 Tax=Prochlorococcus TaxID=1218 RepID=UPI000533A890|nr:MULTISPECIES: AarF/ABC1/UbiB kinase family protein [Prochlorococcus]KGG13754.1 Ubiquinone biosynthesis monooxygenase UbiB [Prochlorococcus sp. MIT 0601]
MTKELTDFIEAEGLLEYDPETIAKIYQKYPYRFIKRLWATLIPITLFLLGVGWDKLLGLLKNKEKARARAKEFADLLVSLGPAFIKAGQALSTRPDIVPSIVLEELAQLQDQLPGFDPKLAMECIEEDLKVNKKDIFKSIEIEPVSAASLGQVHKGVLINGEKVAVKVQRPGLREQITLDLYIVRNIARWLKANIKIIRSDLIALIDELGKRVFEEMDYINEANNAIKFKDLHINNKNIAVPKVYTEHTSRRVLTMEWIEGVKLTDIEKVKQLGISPDEMIEIGVNCSLQQLLEHGFFHADPHPGNLLALEDGRLCYLDFGMMSEVSRESRTGLIQAVVHLVNRSFDKLSKDFVQLGFLSKEVNLMPIVPAFETVFGTALELGVSKMDFKSVTDDLSGVMYKFPFKLPPYYALIIRSLITLEGIALSVDPEFKILGAAYPYFAKRLMEDPDPQLRKSLKEMLFDGETFRWNRLNELMLSAAKQTDIDIENLLDRVLDFLFSAKGGILRKELVEAVVSKFDSFTWKTIQSLNSKLPENIRSTQIKSNESYLMVEIEPIKKIINIAENLPGFNKELIIKKIPRILKEKDTRKMGIKIAKGITEKSIVRMIKLVAGVKQ